MSKKRIGINCEALCIRYGELKALEICAAAGFDAVDFGLERFSVSGDGIYNASDEEICDFFKLIRKRADELGLMISQTHGRCATYRPNDELYNREVLENTKRDLLATAALGAPACVIHSITTSNWRGSSRELMREKNREMYADFILFAEENGVSIALETFGDSKPDGKRCLDFFGDVRELKMQYEAMDTKNKAICVDTGHTHKAHNAEPTVLGAADSIRYLGSDVKLLHLNDNNGFSDQHLPPLFAGDSSYQVDWKEVLRALDDINYSGVYSFELNLRKFGNALEDATRFFGSYLRRFVDGTL